MIFNLIKKIYKYKLQLLIYLSVGIIFLLGTSSIINKLILVFNKKYILISMDNTNYLILIGLILSIPILFILYYRYKKIFKSINQPIKKTYILSFVIILIGIFLGIIYFSNNYYIFYNDKIVKHNMLKTKTYNYTDVISINSQNTYIKNFNCTNYNVSFKDNNSVNIYNGLLMEPNEIKSVLKIKTIIDKNK